MLVSSPLIRIREQPPFVQSLRGLATYSEIPSSIRDYLDYGTKSNLPPSFEPLRTITPTFSLPLSGASASPQPQMPHVSMDNGMFPRMNTGPLPIGNPQGYNAGVGRENPAQKGVSGRRKVGWFHLLDGVFLPFQPSLTQNANIRTLTTDPSYHLVRVQPPPEHINDKISFTFNNLSFANLSQKVTRGWTKPSSRCVFSRRKN